MPPVFHNCRRFIRDAIAAFGIEVVLLFLHCSCQLVVIIVVIFKEASVTLVFCWSKELDLSVGKLFTDSFRVD